MSERPSAALTSWFLLAAVFASGCNGANPGLVAAPRAPSATPDATTPDAAGLQGPRSLATDRGADVAAMRALVEESQGWLKRQLREHRRYSYWSGDGSYSGVNWEYRIDVDRAAVASRSFRRWHAADGPMLSWSEVGEDVGAHPGGLRDNLEVLYQRCVDEVLSAPTADHWLYVTVDNGLLKSCVSVPKECLDDCATGVRVDRIEWH